MTLLFKGRWVLPAPLLRQFGQRLQGQTGRSHQACYQLYVREVNDEAVFNLLAMGVLLFFWFGVALALLAPCRAN